MSVSISKPNWRGWSALRTRAAAAAEPATAEARPAATEGRPRWRGEVDSAWVLTAMMGALCLVALCWFFAHGTAATFWLIALIAIAVAGVPIGLTALRLLRYDDND